MDTDSFINCCYVYIQSVGNKTVEIREFIIDHQIDNFGRLQLGSRSFWVSAPRLFNRLPEEVKGSSNMSVFKRKLETFLFGDCYTDDFRMTERYRIG